MRRVGETIGRVGHRPHNRVVSIIVMIVHRVVVSSVARPAPPVPVHGSSIARPRSDLGNAHVVGILLLVGLHHFKSSGRPAAHRPLQLVVVRQKHLGWKNGSNQCSNDQFILCHSIHTFEIC